MGTCPAIDPAKRLTSYLEGPQNEIENQPQLGLDLFRDEGEHDEIDPKQRNEEQRGLRQPPERQQSKNKRLSQSNQFKAAGGRCPEQKFPLNSRKEKQRETKLWWYTRVGTHTFILVSSSLVYLRSFHVSQTVKLNEKWSFVSSLLTDQFGARNGTHEYWLDSFLPMSGQLIFCRRILMMQMNRMKFICGETRTEFGLEREPRAEPTPSSATRSTGARRVRWGIKRSLCIQERRLADEMRSGRLIPDVGEHNRTRCVGVGGDGGPQISESQCRSDGYHKTLDTGICFLKRVSVGAAVVFSMEIAKHD